MVGRLVLLMVSLGNYAHADARGTVAGTYHLRICGGSCEPGPPLAEGTLVLLADPVRDASAAVVFAGGRDRVNGCFLFTTLRRHGLLGGPGTGQVAWRGDRTNGVLVDFKPGAVDASYVATLRSAPGGLAGEGYSSYASKPRPPRVPADRVFADRQGDAAPAMCAADRLERERGPACTVLVPCR